MANSTLGYKGYQRPTDGTSDYNAISFVVWQILRSISGAKLVRVMSSTNAGGVSSVGFVDVQPLVNQLDGDDNAVDHGTVYHLPYFRLQGGTNAVIMDPVDGDIGVAIIEDRDISAVKSSGAQANPGSRRIFDLADGLYLGGYLNATPEQYFQFSAAGIAVVSPTKISLQAPLVEVDASTSFTVNSLQSDFSGAVSVQGLLSFFAGMKGSIASGVAVVISGAVQFLGTVTANGKRIDDTHTHTSEAPGDPTSPPL